MCRGQIIISLFGALPRGKVSYGTNGDGCGLAPGFTQQRVSTWCWLHVLFFLTVLSTCFRTHCDCEWCFPQQGSSDDRLVFNAESTDHGGHIKGEKIINVFIVCRSSELGKCVYVFFCVLMRISRNRQKNKRKLRDFYLGRGFFFFFSGSWTCFCMALK